MKILIISRTDDVYTNESILNSDYPKDKLQVLIGSDNSTDITHSIIEEFVANNSNITFFSIKH